MYPRKIRNFNAFVDGVSYFGRVKSGKMPELSLNTVEHRAGGMDAPIMIDMGMDALEAELVFSEWSPELMRAFATRTRFVLRAGALGEDDFQSDSIVFTLGGRITKQAQDDFAAGEDVMLTLTMNVDTFRLEHNGDAVIDIDIEAGKRVIGGIDQLASIRASMGL